MNDFQIIGLIGGLSSVAVGGAIGLKYENIMATILGLIIGIIIASISMFAYSLELDSQKEIYDKTVFQPWVKSLDSKSCEELGDQALKQKLLENKTAIDAVLKVFNSKECHFDISSGQVLELLY